MSRIEDLTLLFCADNILDSSKKKRLGWWMECTAAKSKSTSTYLKRKKKKIYYGHSLQKDVLSGVKRMCSWTLPYVTSLVCLITHHIIFA
jgi:hypothetical protein